MDAESRWLVSELLAADCEKALIHPGWEDAVQKWYEWLEKKEKINEDGKMEELRQLKVAQMMKSAEGSANLEPAKQGVEKHRSDLLASGERNADLEMFSRAVIAGVEHRLRVMETQRSVVNEPHEDSEQSFRAEIAIVEERLRTVKEIKGHTRNSQAIKCVERSENVESQTGEMGESEFNVIEFLRVTDLMLWCGLTNTDASRKAERACVNTTSILVYWT